MLALGAEAGIQGTDYGFGVDERYVLASLVLRWNAFRGGADQAALREARALTAELRATRDLASQQVRLEVQQALENLEVADASLATAAKRTEAASGAFRITSRKRDLGQINQAEFIDARRAYTDAALNLTRVRAEFLGATRRAGICRRWHAPPRRGVDPMMFVRASVLVAVTAWLVACGNAATSELPPVPPAAVRAAVVMDASAATADPRGRRAGATQRIETRLQGRRPHRDHAGRWRRRG